MKTTKQYNNQKIHSIISRDIDAVPHHLQLYFQTSLHNLGVGEEFSVGLESYELPYHLRYKVTKRGTKFYSVKITLSLYDKSVSLTAKALTDEDNVTWKVYNRDYNLRIKLYERLVELLARKFLTFRHHAVSFNRDSIDIWRRGAAYIVKRSDNRFYVEFYQYERVHHAGIADNVEGIGFNTLKDLQRGFMLLWERSFDARIKFIRHSDDYVEMLFDDRKVGYIERDSESEDIAYFAHFDESIDTDILAEEYQDIGHGSMINIKIHAVRQCRILLSIGADKRQS